MHKIDLTECEDIKCPEGTPNWLKGYVLPLWEYDGVNIGDRYVIHGAQANIVCFYTMADGVIRYYGTHGGNGTIEWLKNYCTKLT